METDKSTWGDGPWQTEPDEVDFNFGDVQCRLVRNHSGVWCGYVAIPPGHPWYRKDYDRLDADVHGGLTWGGYFGDSTYATKTNGQWWVGFDCNHFTDYAPGLEALLRKVGHRHSEGSMSVYRTVEYARGEVEQLARQAIFAMQPGKKHGSDGPAEPVSEL